MADPFKNPLSPKQMKTGKGLKTATFAAPTKEAATTGRFMAGGDDYGVGFRQPVGKNHAGGLESGPIPQSCKHIDPNDFHFKD